MSKSLDILNDIRKQTINKYGRLPLYDRLRIETVEKDLNKYEKLKALLYEAYGYDEEEYLHFIKVIEDDR